MLAWARGALNPAHGYTVTTANTDSTLCYSVVRSSEVLDPVAGVNQFSGSLLVALRFTRLSTVRVAFVRSAA